MLTEKELFDRIYAGWMGKNIGGTLGGPLEGRMELMDVHGYTQEFVGAVENDDLDLQLVNLHCVEQYGGRADMALLSNEWRAHVHFQFDEYGHSLTNMRRGIGAPLSGCYNNFFRDCMGSPIRSEIWAMLCAGMPDLAAYYAYHDASVDHAGGEGVYGEIFFAVMESLAFETDDPNILIERGLKYLPASSEVRQAVEMMVDCHRKGMTWQQARTCILDRFGGENFTYAPINIAFTLVGLLYETGFTRKMEITVNCGYDTDCTVATLGSLLGIMYGPKYLDSQWTDPLGENILVSRPITGFSAPKTIRELAERTIAARRLVQEHYAQQADKSVFAISYDTFKEIHILPEGSCKAADLTAVTEYEGNSPAFAPGQSKQIRLTLKNHQDMPLELLVKPRIDGFTTEQGKMVTLVPHGSAECSFMLTAPDIKKAYYRGAVVLTHLIHGVEWDEYLIPITLLPTMDWRLTVDGQTEEMHFETNRMDTDRLIHPGITRFTAESMLVVPSECEARLEIVCKNPIRLLVDGVVRAECAEETIVIPAYHRADARKCASLHLEKGTHKICVEVGEPEKLKDLFFYIVDEGLYFAYQIDKVFR